MVYGGIEFKIIVSRLHGKHRGQSHISQANAGTKSTIPIVPFIHVRASRRVRGWVMSSLTAFS